jgi:hypothetical protein
LAGYSQPHAGQEDRADLGRIRGIAQEQGKPIVMVSIKTSWRTAGPISTLPFGPEVHSMGGHLGPPEAWNVESREAGYVEK